MSGANEVASRASTTRGQRRAAATWQAGVALLLSALMLAGCGSDPSPQTNARTIRHESTTSTSEVDVCVDELRGTTNDTAATLRDLCEMGIENLERTGNIYGSDDLRREAETVCHDLADQLGVRDPARIRDCVAEYQRP
jgi:hypothetical protein